VKRRRSLVRGLPRRRAASEPLTVREVDVLRLIALGHTNTELGRVLGIRPKTVETHRKNIMAKLGLKSRAELVGFSLAHGLVTTGPGGAFFQCCLGCKVLWSLRSQFLSDREVKFLGYERNQPVDAPGSLLFVHERCGSKLGLPLESFRGLTRAPLTAESCAARGEKAEHCLAQTSATECPLKCVCAFVWQTSHLIRDWPKVNGTGLSSQS
jgi:DNA-binding CsgD family transcriptional regulator